jgi:hypothetical protein
MVVLILGPEKIKSVLESKLVGESAKDVFVLLYIPVVHSFLKYTEKSNSDLS